MRFAIKTRPEHQTWEEIRDAWLVVNLPLHAKPDSLQPLAAALEPLA